MTENSKKSQVLDALRVVIDPDLGQDIVTLGFIKELNIEEHAVSFTVELTTPACPLKAQFKTLCEDAVSALSWVDEVKVKMSARPQKKRGINGSGLARVGHIVGVSSCKGGVGKSTVAVNLAYVLAQSGAKVGIFDADVYGPSLPTLVKLADTEVRSDGNLIQPLEFKGVKLMSFGYVTQATDAAIMRGPMVSSVINQLAGNTNWGALDYLIVDMPPGTGDIQLTLTQNLPFTGAVIVTTPQKLSFVDVVRGISMFNTVKVPTLAVVENMSHFVCDSCDKKHFPFGQGAMDRLKDQFGIENRFEIPLLPEMTRLSDLGRPAVLEQPEGKLGSCYSDIAGAVVREISRLEHGSLVHPAVRFEEGKGIVVTSSNGQEHIIDSADLRRRCSCAACKDEFTGEPILHAEDIADDVIPTEIEPVGNYAVGIKWSDGHTSSIYPYDSI
ncbi:MAG: P-loop NTPase [Proteobacteria bacterium]|nr:P-loop NTPase [Pseudomonadota bacterium]